MLAWLEQLAQTVRLELFVVIGTFLEEVVAPIPSPFVMTTAAAVSRAQQLGWWEISLLILLASATKTLTSTLIYVLSDKAEDVVVGKLGKYVGISHDRIESIGQWLTGSWWDDMLLFLSRAIPVIPMGLISIAAGVIKYNLRSFILWTFLGAVVRNLIYFWFAVVGISGLSELWQRYADQPWLLAAAGALGVGLAIYLFSQKDHLAEKLLRKKTKTPRP